MRMLRYISELQLHCHFMLIYWIHQKDIWIRTIEITTTKTIQTVQWRNILCYFFFRTLSSILARGFSRIPVYHKKDRGHIIGCLLVKKLVVVGAAEMFIFDLPSMSISLAARTIAIAVSPIWRCP